MIHRMSFDPRANLMCEAQHRGCVFLPRFPRPEHNTALKLTSYINLLVCIKCDTPDGESVLSPILNK
jgi:hypothetical protein